jgi:hypothetical protein
LITEFTNNSDFKRVIEEQQIKPSKLKYFLKGQGIVLLNNNAQDLAQAAFTFFLGSNDMASLQELIQSEKNYQKSTMFYLKAEITSDESDDFQNILTDEISRFRTITLGKYELEDIYTNEDVVHVKFSFEKTAPGRMKFISKKKKTLNVSIEKVIGEPGVLKLDVRQVDATDVKEFLSFLEILKSPVTQQTNLFHINRIKLELLENQRKIEFFDLLSKYKFDDWILNTITGITVNKNYGGENDIEEVDSGNLSGIKTAILKGSGLRTNEFVQNCLTQGFIINSMKLKYNHKTEVKSAVVDVNFNNDDIRIDIDKTYQEDDEGKEFVTPLPFVDQDKIIKQFQNVSYDIYKELLDRQRNEAIAV